MWAMQSWYFYCHGEADREKAQQAIFRHICQKVFFLIDRNV
jgi:hypothetical protein